MGLRVNTNVASMQSIANLQKSTKKKEDAMQKLSTGNRINRAADDAAGLAISENLKADIRSSKQAIRNSSDGISMIQTAEGGLNEVSNILIRLRELAIQTASDTMGDNERQFSDVEFQNLIQEVDRIANVTSFNGAYLLNGEGGTHDFQIGVQNNPENDRLSYLAEATNTSSAALQIEGLAITSKEDARSTLEKIDFAINGVNRNRANLGALQNRLTSTISNLMIKTENTAAANSRIRDADVAVQSSELAKNNIISAAGASVLAQANASMQLALKLL